MVKSFICRVRLLIGVLAVLAGALGMNIGVAGAEPATVTNFHECQTFPNGFSICVDLHTQNNVTSTPSGNSVIVFNGYRIFTVTNSSGQQVFEDNIQTHFVLVQGQEGVQVANRRFSRDLLSSTFERCFSVHAHFANGELRFSTTSTAC